MEQYKQSGKPTQPITAHTPLGDLLCENFPLLLIVTRYGIPLGFGEKTVGQVCKEYGLDTNTLLIILNLSIGLIDRPSRDQLASIRLDSLIRYLSNSHAYFLDYRLPELRQRLLSAISNCPQEVAIVIRNFYDEYVEEVRKHMSYEEKTVFPYALKLEAGERDEHYSISIFSKRHDHIELKIIELKNLLIRYYPAPGGFDLNNVLHEIFSSEYELAAHNLIEDNVFIPYIIALEQQVAKQ